MNIRRPLALSVLAIVFGCEGHQAPTAPTARSVPYDPSEVLSDGAHGGNPDFFFLPPLVPLPLNNPNFELGKFNNTLGPSIRIEICKLNPEYNASNVQVLPLPHTQCVTDNPVKTFPAGTVQLVNLPLSQMGWWTAYHLPPDGFYYVLWDTRQSNLDVNSYYRIKVFVDGNAIPMGFADVDPMANIWQWKSALTGQVIQLVNGWLLPIPFRIENGALCGGANSCTSTTVTNFDPSGSQTVTVDGGAGAIAGAKFPNGWLPAGGPQSVVVTISSVNTGPSDPATGTQTNPCHTGLNLQQFDECFKFTTTPTLLPQTNGKQFAIPVTVAVCYVLQGTGDPREKFAEMYASGPSEPPHALPDVSDVGILGAGARDCSTTPVIGSTNSNPLARLATTGWRRLKGGLHQLFGVKTAYAVDGGLGGLLDGFSNVGVALTGQISRSSVFGKKLGYGEVRPSLVSITGTQAHTTEGPTLGIKNVPVTFTVLPGGGGLNLTQNVGTATQMTVMTNQTGFAEISWTMPSVPGIYTLTATAPAFGGPITFADTVRGARLMLSMQTGASYQIVVPPPAVSNWASSSPAVDVSPTGLVTAIVGGENINGGNAATLASSVAGVEAHSVLVNSFAFDRYLRETTLVWNPVNGATSYDVVTDFGNGCAGGTGNCTSWTNNPAGTTTTSGTTFTFGFVGAQPGRWHVVAKDALGNVLSTSAFVYFGYNI